MAKFFDRSCKSLWEVYDFIEVLEGQNPVYESMLKTFSNLKFISELTEIKKVFFLTDSIKELEKQCLNTPEQVNIILTIKDRLVIVVLKEKYLSLLEKNPDLYFFSILTR
ncbi:hypothetical protein DMUE_2885 [Dictyocoela muelleri]|nr:hypothetical protein DMUE_2885 [Dictyocoela muelleri]